MLLYQLGLPTGLALVTTQGCGDCASDEEASRTVLDAALDTLVAELVAERPADAAMYAERLQAYLVAHPAFPDGIPPITPGSPGARGLRKPTDSSLAAPV